MALTFDACGGPGGNGYDDALVGLLVSERIPATLFVAARWLDEHPDEADALADEELFELANHGAAHKPCSVTGRVAFGIPGTESPGAARQEIRGGSERIAQLIGAPPRFYRPGTGFFDGPCVSLVRELGQRPIGFTVSGDGGASFPKERVQRAVAEAPDGAIVLLHLNHPEGAAAEGLEAALPSLRKRGVKLVKLSDAL